MNSREPAAALSRRAFLAGTGLAIGALAGCTSPESSGAGSAAPEQTDAGGFLEPALRSSSNGTLDTTIRVAESRVKIAGQTVRALIYEGSYPGPTLEVRKGDTLKVGFINNIGDTTNLHTHGLHVSPDRPADDVLLTVEPNDRFDYVYPIRPDERGGTLWYHAHLHMATDKQVFGGMFGMLVVRGEFDELPGIKGVPERVLVISQIELKDDAIMDGDDSSTSKQLTLVNGQRTPTIEIAPGQVQRWRVLNASSVFLRLTLDGHQLHLIAVDGNALTATRAMGVVEVPPGGRIDVLVQGGAPATYEFRSLSWEPSGVFYTSMVPVPQTLVHLVSKGADTAAKTPLSTTLLPMKDLRQSPIDRRRVFRFEEREPRGVGPNHNFSYYINGALFDPNVVNETMKLGATEEWEFINLTYEPHPIHIHVNPFQVITINGQPADEPHYRDTVTLPPFGNVTIRHQFLDYTGKFVMHCHILFHEDHGMMQLLEVVA